MFVLINRKVSPGLMPPGSPGTYRRKSASSDLPPLKTDGIGIGGGGSSASPSSPAGRGTTTTGGISFGSVLSTKRSSTNSAGGTAQRKSGTLGLVNISVQPSSSDRHQHSSSKPTISSTKAKITQLQQELSKTVNGISGTDSLRHRSKMAGDSAAAPTSSQLPVVWPNLKEDYDLREVIGI